MIISIFSSSDQSQPDFASHQSTQDLRVITSDEGSAISSDDEDSSDNKIPPVENSYDDELDSLLNDSDD